MKKCLALMLSALLILSFSVFNVFAAENEVVSIELSFSNENNALTVSGHVVSEREEIPMTLYISGTSNSVTLPITAGETTAAGRDAKGVPFQFDAVKLSSGMPSTTLTISVTAAWLDVTKTVTYEYIGVVDQVAVLKDLNTYISQNNSTSFENEVVSGLRYMGVEEAAFNNLTGLSRTIAVKNLMKLTYTLPNTEDGITAAEATQIKNEVTAFETQYKEATELGAFFNLTSAAGLSAWYDKNKATYGFLNDVLETTTVDETKMLPYFNAAIQSDDYLDRLENMSNVTSMAELNIAMKHQGLLQAVENGDKYDIKNIITDFSPLLTGLDYTSWNSLSDADKLLTCAAVGGGSYANFTDFVNAVNVGIYSPAQIPTINNSGNRNPGGGRGDGTVAIPSTVLEADKNSIADGTPFTDLSNVSWAKEAITELYKKGIVSGRTAKSFEPNAPVTRAELIKMLVSALDISVSSVNTSFKDVEPSYWYAGYVSAAEANGLINGDENGNFNPEKPISRQDAATILYRSYNNKNVVKKSDFTDRDAISDYAKEAVDYMVSKGIINGMGNGEFAPLNNISRAQLSKMIYLMIK